MRGDRYRVTPQLLRTLSRGRIRAVNHRTEILRSVKGTKPMKRLQTLVLAIGLFGLTTATTGCAGLTFPTALTDIRSAVDVAQMVITAIETFGQSYFTAHPSQADQAKFNTLVAQAEASAAAALAAANGASDLKSDNVAAAFNDFETVYSNLLALGQSLGIKISAMATKPGAEQAGDILVVPPASVLRPAMIKAASTGPVSLRSPGDSTPKTWPTFLGLNSDGTWSAPVFGLPQTEVVPAIGCLNGTVLRKESAGEWDCRRPDEPLTGDLTTDTTNVVTIDGSPYFSVLSLELSDTPLLTVVDRPGPSACPVGMHDGTVFAPGAVCVRDGLRWSSVLARLRAECERQDGCTAEQGGPWMQAIFDVSRARIQRHTLVVQ